ncbi:hypothetical protein FisN_10Hu335 [Fistulifera solaris]|uniref:DUF6824 domain-containing protein n=1 Tax=Fistulifera solaris TaxID=1519565 RepID=A0A1Z5JRE3_FISSO|nr:hypothetical protein FisN_10Hu335 [Fistulifera solaris]|eukprot:GAX16422.1 hypothetical protein FisN_10Hu335 [Fistulifera solaris]
MSESTIESSDWKQKATEQILLQHKNRSVEIHNHRHEAGAFRTHQSQVFPAKAASSDRVEGRQDGNKKASEKKLVAEVLARYWRLKEMQQSRRAQPRASYVLDGDTGVRRPSQQQKTKMSANTTQGDHCHPDSFKPAPEHQSKSSIQPAFGDLNGRDDSSSLPSEERDYKFPAQIVFPNLRDSDASMTSESAKSQNKRLWRSNPVERDGQSSFYDPRSLIGQPQHVRRGAAKGQLGKKGKVHPSEAITPVDPDVLFGRRQAQRKHPGNMRLRELCHEFQEEYRKGDRGHKTSITWRIVHMIQQEGGRFLKFDEDWMEVDNDMAREKVAFTIRDAFHQVPARET